MTVKRMDNVGIVVASHVFGALAAGVGGSTTAFSGIKPQIVGWEKIVDLPAHDDLHELVDPQVLHELVGEDVSVLGQPLQGSKVGGYPRLIQSEIFWAPDNRHPSNPRFVIQIDSHEDLGITWGDGGILYLGRGTGVSKKGPGAGGVAHQAPSPPGL